MQGRTVSLLLAAAVALGLAASFALKEPCTLNSWEDHFQYRHYCYSDVLPLYYRFHLHEEPPRFPYLVPLEELGGTAVEYPVLTVVFAWLVALPTASTGAYMHLTAVLLLACGAVVSWALWRSGVDWRRVAFFALGPPIIIHGLTNWDLFAVALAALGWWAWRKEHPLLAALFFGLGGAAKIYPAFFLPYLAFDCLLRRDRRGLTDVTVGGLLGLVLPNLVAWRLSPTAWMDVWRFHAKRRPDFETPFEVVREWLSLPQTDLWSDLIGRGGLLLVAAIGLALAWAAWKRGLGPLVAGGLATVAFLLFNRVYSPQYTLWVFPILLAMRAPWRTVALFVAADLAVFLLRYPLLTGGPHHETVAFYHGIAVVARWLFLAACMWQVARQEGLVPSLAWWRRGARDEAPAKAAGE